MGRRCGIWFRGQRRVNPQQWEITPRAGITCVLPTEPGMAGGTRRGEHFAASPLGPQGPQPLAQTCPRSLPCGKGDCHDCPTQR